MAVTIEPLVHPIYLLTAEWRVLHGRWDVGPEYELRDWGSLTLAWPLAGQGRSVTLTAGAAEAASQLRPRVSDVWVYRAEELLFRGRVVDRQRDLVSGRPGEFDVNLAFTAVDYRELLTRRYLPAQVTYTAVEQAAIVWDLINDSQSRPGGHLGITQGIALSSQLRDRTYEAGDEILQLIDQMSNVIDGFDWEISPQLELNIWSEHRGTETGLVLDYGGLVAELQERTVSADFANAWWVSGDPAFTTPVIRESVTVATDPAGRWEGAASYPSVVEQTTVAEKADGLLHTSEADRLEMQGMLAADVWRPGLITPGDWVYVEWPNEDGVIERQRQKITDLAFTATGDGDEQIRFASITDLTDEL